LFTTFRGYGHAIALVCFTLAATAPGLAAPITFAQIQEQVVLSSASGPMSLLYDSGQLNQFHLAHDIGLPSLTTILAGRAAQSTAMTFMASWLHKAGRHP
jgi:hypothetical protein